MNGIDFERADELLGNHGGWSYSRWARETLRAGMVAPEFLEQAHVRLVASALRRHGKATDASGLPRIGPTAEVDEDGDRVVQLRLHWGPRDYQHNINDRRAMAAGNIMAINALADECEQRFHIRPTMDRLPDLDYGEISYDPAA